MLDFLRQLLSWLIGEDGQGKGTSQPFNPLPQGEPIEGQPINDAEAYGVRIVPVQGVSEGPIWRVVRVHHLTPQENGGRHHIFIDMLDEDGKRINGAEARVTWDGGEQIVRVDKPPSEPGTNFPMWRWQVCAVEGVGLPSDRVENLHTGHPDEAPGNTLFHHSFLVVFKRTQAQPPARSVLEGRIRFGEGRTVILMRDGQEVARAVVGADGRFRFEGLPAGRYQIRIADSAMASEAVELDGASARELTLSLAGVIEGWVHGGAGRTVAALKPDGDVAGQALVAEDESFRIADLAPGDYVVAVEGTDVRSQTIALAPGAVETLELTLPEEQPSPVGPPLEHYVLLGPKGAPGERTNYLLASEYIAHFRLAFGYSLDDARHAGHVVIIGDGYGPEDEAALLGAGCRVERINGGPDAIRDLLAARIRSGKP